jgi:hypothetical protein
MPRYTYCIPDLSITLTWRISSKTQLKSPSGALATSKWKGGSTPPDSELTTDDGDWRWSDKEEKEDDKEETEGEAGTGEEAGREGEAGSVSREPSEGGEDEEDEEESSGAASIRCSHSAHSLLDLF